MSDTQVKAKMKREKSRWRKWLRRGFVIWTLVSTGLLANSFRTRGVDALLLQSDALVSLYNGRESLQFLPQSLGQPGLIFVCGAGVSADAYAPLLRPIAEEGFPVFAIKLPYRCAPLESHKLGAIQRVYRVMREHTEVPRWVLAGHSLGGALVCRIARDHPESISALVLVGTTHPKSDSLATLRIPVTKVYGANDGVAPSHKINANRHLLPQQTRFNKNR